MVTYTVAGMKTDQAQDVIGLLGGSLATGNARTEQEAAERATGR
ncbi:MAG TPA: hypothetical protein VGG35_13515 [Streptosporangiaceae bacterium]|jgi:hypothetical protein